MPAAAPDRAPSTRVMGILNVTPDSFSDGGRFDRLEAAVGQARRIAAEGADLLDIGGESTRPGHVPVDAQTELARVLPVLDALGPDFPIPISIDTTKAIVAAAALRRGARIVNDVWGLMRDADIARVAADADADLVIMHNREKADPSLDIVEELLGFFDTALGIARRAGMADERIVLDPGFGFGKTPEQSLDAIRRLAALKRLGFPLLVGVSRKSTIGVVTGKPVGERLAGTIAMNAFAMLEGVDIIRVHDVAEHVDARKIIERLRA
jgi:dihydropteroate synthase